MSKRGTQRHIEDCLSEGMNLWDLAGSGEMEIAIDDRE